MGISANHKKRRHMSKNPFYPCEYVKPHKCPRKTFTTIRPPITSRSLSKRAGSSI